MKRRSKWVKVLVSVLLSVVLMVQMTGVAWGVSVELNVPINSQTKDELCCWACCGTSMCEYYGINLEVTDFIMRVKFTNSRYTAGTLGDAQLGMAYNGVLSDTNLSDSTYLGSLNYYIVKDEIDAGRPMIGYATVYDLDENNEPILFSHAVLITGYDSTNRAIRITDSIGMSSEYYDNISYPTAENPYQITEGFLYNIRRNYSMTSLEVL